MRRYSGWLLALLIGLCTTPAFAQPSIGLRIGAVRVDDDMGIKLNGGAKTLGALLGLQVATFQDSWISAELDANFTVDRADAGPDREWGITTVGAYVAANIGRAFYAKGKLGLVYEYISVTGGPGINDDDIGFSGGVGVGLKAGDHWFGEVEATLIDKNAVQISGHVSYRW
jgi:hypothetical protein